jgi:hypothetical protein
LGGWWSSGDGRNSSSTGLASIHVWSPWAASHKQVTHQLWMKKNLAARYKAMGGQQARERAASSCISPHKQNIEHVMGEVEERSGLAVPEQRQDLQPMRRSSSRL